MPTRRGSRCVPPAPGMMPSVTSGSPTTASRRGDAGVAAERQLQAAAERDAMDGGDHRLRAILDRGDHRRQAGLDRRLVELLDVGAGNEALAGSDDHAGDGATRRYRAAAPRRGVPARTAMELALTGGLSMTMTPTEPSVSRRTGGARSVGRLGHGPRAYTLAAAIGGSFGRFSCLQLGASTA